VEGEYPAHWRPLANDVALRYRSELEPIWTAAERASANEVAERLTPIVSKAMREILERLYPEAREVFESARNPQRQA
jgi:hypothetical protein